MPKNSRVQIKEDEEKILHELRRNANKSVNEIAKNCGFSRQKVWRIIKNLEKNKTIWGYVPVVDEEKKDLEEYMLFIKRTQKPTTEEIIEKVIGRELLEKRRNIGVKIVSSVYTNGAYDWVFCFLAKDIIQAKKFVEILNDVFKGYIDETILIEKIFTIEKGGIANPDVDSLREFIAID